MLRLAPQDYQVIKLFTDAIKVGTFSLPYQKAPEYFTVIIIYQWFNTDTVLLFLKWKNYDWTLAARITNPVLRKLF